jgi:hypothetical protein
MSGSTEFARLPFDQIRIFFGIFSSCIDAEDRFPSATLTSFKDGFNADQVEGS